jgi:PAS domain S-box-containing protein
MAHKPSYEDLEQRVKELEKEVGKRKEAGEELRKYQFMVESAHDAIFCKDLGSRYISANDKTLEAFGLSRKDVIGKNDYELMPDQQEAKKNVHDDQIVFKSGKPTEVIKHITRADGKECWFQAIKVPQFDNDGKVIGLVGIARDVTKQKSSEKALRKSEEEYHRLYKLMRLMADNIPDLIWAKDMDGRYIFVNQAMCDKLIMCDCPDRAIGMTNMVIAEKERNAGYEHTFGEICSNSDAIVQERKVACRILEERFVRNEYLVLDVHKAPFLDENKEMIGTVGCGRDVTNEKEIEKALKEREIELKRKNLRLEELNSALKILLEKRDGDKKVLEEKVLMNIKNLIIPYIVKLKKTPLNDRQEIFVEIIQSNIDDILSPFAHKLSYKYLNFTPTELQVADLVKQGLRTKEIADLLNSSPETVSGHRKSMRKKLNLKDKKSNLRTHLLSLDNGYN